MTHRTAARKPGAALVIEGACARPSAFSHYDLGAIHDDYQVEDLAKVDARLKGKAVRLRKLVDLVGPDFYAKYITIESEDGKFAASLPLDDTMRTALVVYEMKGKPLTREDGGPVRFIIPFFADKCANVKGAVKMTLTESPGRDTRPSNKTDHDALHAAEKTS
ncbi:MAG: molybdopterin-dependent oxidoreductase [Planctomycetota bacterium]|jgi:DMSO/TMAO reductase YedYZ molybdopterin-dependent catalytic subunit|nr:molybdopterin-dependent oxidoreductase [Planctomycetota bacterium]